MNWYDKYSDEEIKAAQANERPWGLIPQAMRDLIYRADVEGITLEVYTANGWEEHKTLAMLCDVSYRLPPTWKRPEPEKQGYWECCEVSSQQYVLNISRWKFARGGRQWSLKEAEDMVGFGGIEFEESPGAWVMGPAFLDESGMLVNCAPQDDINDRHKPATPKCVRFWVGEK